jgi:hypothetical protein
VSPAPARRFPDESTADLTASFFEELQRLPRDESASYAKTLHLAQVKLRR